MNLEAIDGGRMDARSSKREGWFPHHPSGAAAIEELADRLDRQCAELDRLARATPAPMWDSGAGRSRVRHHTDRIMGRVQALAGSIQEFGDAVAQYDERIDRLNARWLAEHERDFGVPPVSVGSAATPAQVAAADQDHADQVSRARSAVARSLAAEYELAQAELVVAEREFDRTTRRRRSGHGDA